MWITKNQNWNAPIKADQINCPVMHIPRPAECLQEYAQISWLIEAYRVREREKERDQVPGEFGLDENWVHQIWLMVHKPINQLEASEPISCLYFSFLAQMKEFIVTRENKNNLQEVCRQTWTHPINYRDYHSTTKQIYPP
jgi:hypothetical protein